MTTAHAEAWKICDGLRDELIRDGSTQVFNTIQEKFASAIAAARIEGAKAMQERCEKECDGEVATGTWSKRKKTSAEIRKAIAALDPATVVGGGE